jgi:hypothetical protein
MEQVYSYGVMTKTLENMIARWFERNNEFFLEKGNRAEYYVKKNDKRELALILLYNEKKTEIHPPIANNQGGEEIEYFLKSMGYEVRRA